MAEIIIGLYAEAGFSDLESNDLSCTQQQWSGIAKRLIKDHLIFIDEYDCNGRNNMDFIYSNVHNDMNEEDGSWDELQGEMRKFLTERKGG